MCPRRIDALYKARDVSIQDFGFKDGSVCISFRRSYVFIVGTAQQFLKGNLEILV